MLSEDEIADCHQRGMQFLWVHLRCELYSRNGVSTTYSGSDMRRLRSVVQHHLADQRVSRHSCFQFSQVRNSCSIHCRSVAMIVKEISSYIFNDSSCSSLSAYFQLCRENDLQNSIPSSVKGISLSATSHAVRRKLVDISLSGVLNTISSTLNPRRDSFDKGSSESFFGNALNSSDLKTPPLEPIDEDTPLTLTNSLHLQESPCVSAYHSPSLSPEWTLDDNDSTETCKKNYRRMSVSTITPFVLHGGIGDGGTPDVDVIECSSAQPSFVYESVRTSFFV